MVDRVKIVRVRLQANFDSNIGRAHIPRAGVAHDLSVPRTLEHGTLPERLWQRRKSERRVEAFRGACHPRGVPLLALHLLRGGFDTGLRIGLQNVLVDVAPRLRPHVSQ